MNTRVIERPGPRTSNGTPVDPRIRRRRVEVTRAEGRRRLRILLAFLGMAVAMAAGWAATRSALLDVDRVRVAGAGHTPAAAVIEASGVARGQALIDVDTVGAERAVTALPWVLEAEVEKGWPGTVAISVVERRPVAAVEGPGEGGTRWALVDSTGRVLEWVSQRPPALTVITGTSPLPVPGHPLPEATADALAVAAAVPESLRARVVAVSGTGSGVDLMLEEGGRIRMGTPGNLMEKFRSIATVMNRVNTSGLDVLDVSVPDSPVLTRR